MSKKNHIRCICIWVNILKLKEGMISIQKQQKSSQDSCALLFFFQEKLFFAKLNSNFN